MIFTDDQKQNFLDGLKEIRDGRIVHKFTGICSNLSDISGKYAYPFVGIYACGWGKHSGSVSYPVPRPTMGANDMWSGEYGRRRLELVAFLIAKLEDQLAGHDKNQGQEINEEC